MAGTPNKRWGTEFISASAELEGPLTLTDFGLSQIKDNKVDLDHSCYTSSEVQVLAAKDQSPINALACLKQKKLAVV